MTKYQGSRPRGFRREGFLKKMFPYVNLCKTCDPGAGPFWFHMTLGRGHFGFTSVLS